MKKRSIFLIILIFCVIFSISSVVASDINDTSIASDIENNQEYQQPILKSDESGTDDADSIKEATKISVKSVSGKEKSRVKLTATVKTISNNPAKNVKVTFNVNGKIYSSKTNSKGIAKVNIKVPKTQTFKISSKTKNKIITKTTQYKKTYDCSASVTGNDNYTSSSAKFKVTSTKNKKVQKYKIIKKQVKTITIPYKKWGYKEKTSGHYVFGILHEQLEGNRISIVAGDKTLHKYIKFSSKLYYLNHGQKVYVPNNKWLKSKRNTDIHEYYYTGEAKMYVTIKYTAYTYKKI